MADQFETLKPTRPKPGQISKTVRNLRGLPAGLELDPARAEALTIGNRLWTFIMTKQAVRDWKLLGSVPVTLGILAAGLDRPFFQRALVALPGKGGAIVLEMHDSEGGLLWKGTAKLDGDVLEFSMPITRPGVRAKGRMAGRLTAKGQLTLTDARLPKPTNKRKATFESEE